MMTVLNAIGEMRAASRGWRARGLRVGLVPTMGALHEGHLSLVRCARKCSDVVVVSLFVNPTQFVAGEDYSIYPRDEGADIALCQREGVDAIFIPDALIMYSADHSVVIVESDVSKGLCGAFRPGHFTGVLTVVAKLFNIVEPSVAIFGQKDAQQVCVIRRMVRDLNIGVEIVDAPIVRESDGLAMSSRNRYLSESERRSALAIFKSLREAESRFRSGMTSADELVAAVRAALVREPGVKPQYIAVVDADNLAPLQNVDRRALCAVAAHVGRTRLIDNMILDPAIRSG